MVVELALGHAPHEIAARGRGTRHHGAALADAPLPAARTAAAHQEPGHLDLVLRALADPTRRDIVSRVMVAELSVSALAETYPMSFAAVQKHVAVLERATLVSKRRHGREQLVAGDPQVLQGVHHLLDRLEETWRSRVEQMSQVLAEDPTPGPGA